MTKKKTLFVLAFIVVLLIGCLTETGRAYFELGFKAGMLPINFYGQIVDQYGVPVAGAIVTYETTGALLAHGKGIGKLRTDKQGRFEIHSEGGTLVLRHVAHPDITFSFPSPNSENPTKPSSAIWFVAAQKTYGGKDPLWTDTSPGRPYVFTAWRVEKYEKVMTGDLNSYQIPDGRIYTFKFDKKKYKERREEGSTDGHLWVSCTRGPIEREQDQVDWRVTITPVDGGIQAADSLYYNLAPEEGYQPSLTIDMRKGSPDFKKSLSNQRYFFTAKNGQVYGSLKIYIYPNTKQGEKCTIDITQYKVNLNGSRNLAVKPKY